MGVAFVPGSFNAAQFAASPSPQTLAFSQAVTPGNLLEVTVGSFAGSATSFTVSDSINGTYSVAIQTGGSGNQVGKYYIPNTAGGTPTVTVTPNQNTALSIAVAEYSGVNQTAPVTNTTAAFGTTSTPGSGTVTIANPGDLVTAAYAQGTRAVTGSTVSSPFTNRAALLNGAAEAGLGTADDTNALVNEGATFNSQQIVVWIGCAASYAASVVVPQIPQYAPEIVHGPPMRGAPFAQLLPITPSVVQRPPPALPSPSFIISPEIKGGPPLRGAPWLQHLPVQPSIVQLAPNVIPSGTIIPHYAAEVRSGPPMRGAPFGSAHLAGQLQNLVQAPPPAARVGSQIYAPEIAHGPAMRGAPWVAVLPIPPPTFSPSTAPPPPPPPPAPRPGQLAPLLPRDPVQDPRMRRFTELASQIVNSLIGKGQLLQTSPTSWAIASGAFEVARAPGPGDDSTVGVTPGVLWINTATNGVYVNISDAPGSAVWLLVGGGGGGGSGLSGSFP
jgi:hypothetical protein